MASLVVIEGPGQGVHFLLTEPLVSVGRDDTCTFQVLDALVSRKHLQIRYDKQRDQYLAFDMKSRHGVLINGNRIQNEVPLADNDKIELGPVALLFTTKDFTDRASALAYHKKVGERVKGTLLE